MEQLAAKETDFSQETKIRAKTEWILNILFLFQALKSQDTRTMEAEGDDEDEIEDISSTAGPQLAGGVTERSNSTSKGRSSQILYVITSSPGKPEHNMPGQWAGRGETTGHNASM